MADPRSGLVVHDGMFLLPLPRFKSDPARGLQEIKNLPTRPTDILLCAAVKAGSHWLFEILSMLVAGNLKYSEEYITTSNLESADHDKLAERSDPRILHCHLPFKYLPDDNDEKEYKIVNIMRNPKDRLVSRFNFMLGKVNVPLDYPWEDFFKDFVLKPEKETYGQHYSYIKEWKKQINLRPQNIHLVYYEELKKNFKETVQGLADFLGLKRSDSFIEDLETACNLENMKQNKADDTAVPGLSDGNCTLYRKGEVGDWKNYFTVAQNETFDALLAKEMEGSDLKFVYE